MSLDIITANTFEGLTTQETAVAATFKSRSDLMDLIPFETWSTGEVERFFESEIGVGASRGLYGTYPSDIAKKASYRDSVAMLGIKFDYDNALDYLMSDFDREKQYQTLTKLKSLLYTSEDMILNGDVAATPGDCNGIIKRIPAVNDISAGSDADGNQLSITLLQQTLQYFNRGDTVILASPDMRRLISNAAKDNGLSGNIVFNIQDFGRVYDQFDGFPIITIGEDLAFEDLIGFDEPSATGNPVTTSIYIMRLGTAEGVHIGINKPLTWSTIKTDHNFVDYQLDWHIGLSERGSNNIIRLRHIRKAPVVA